MLFLKLNLEIFDLNSFDMLSTAMLKHNLPVKMPKIYVFFSRKTSQKGFNENKIWQILLHQQNKFSRTICTAVVKIYFWAVKRENQRNEINFPLWNSIRNVWQVP